MSLDYLYALPLRFEQALICSLILVLLGYAVLRVSSSCSRLLAILLNASPYLLLLLPDAPHSATLLYVQVYLSMSLFVIAVLSPCMGLLFGEQGWQLQMKAACFWFACSASFLIRFDVLDQLEVRWLSNQQLLLVVLGCLLLGLLGSIARFLQSTLQVAFWSTCLLLALVLTSDGDLARSYLPASVRAWLGLPASMQVALLDGHSEEGALDPVHLEQYLNGYTDRSGTRYAIHTVSEALASDEVKSQQYFREEKPDLLVISDRAMQSAYDDRFQVSNEALGRYEDELATLVEQAREVGTHVIFFITNSRKATDDYQKRMMHCARLFQVPYIDAYEVHERLFPEGEGRMDETIVRVVQEYFADRLMQNIHQ